MMLNMPSQRVMWEKSLCFALETEDPAYNRISRNNTRRSVMKDPGEPGPIYYMTLDAPTPYGRGYQHGAAYPQICNT